MGRCFLLCPFQFGGFDDGMDSSNVWGEMEE